MIDQTPEQTIETPPSTGTHPSHSRPPLGRDELRAVLASVLRAGQLMLENGANTARVEETMHHLGTALGAEWLDVAVTPQNIIVSVVSAHEHRTRIQRVTKSGVDLSRVAAVIDVSRQAERGELTTATALAALNQIARQPRIYNAWLTTLAVALACAAFAVLFGGGAWEGGVVALAAGLGQLLRHSLLQHNQDRLLVTALVSACASGAALGLSLGLSLGLPLLGTPQLHVTVTLAASVLLLVPGVLLVSGTADLFRGDVLPGMARLATATLFVLMIAIGIWAVLLLTQVVVDIRPSGQPNVVLAMLMAAIAATGFAVLFDVPRCALPAVALVGMLAVSTRAGIVSAGLPPEVGSFCAGVVVGVLAHGLARPLRMLTSVFSIPGFVPLVPGVLAFRAVLNFVNTDYLAGLTDLVQAMLIIVAITAGLGVVNAVLRARRPSLF